MKLKALLLSLLSCITTAAAQEGFELKPVVQGFDSVIALTSVASEPSKLFVVERSGVVAIVENGKRAKRDLLNIEDILAPQENAGLSGVAFPPNYAQTKELYVSYTDKQGDTIVGRFATKAGDTVDEDSLIVVLKVVQPNPHAHRSTITFAGDDTLLIGLGDAPRKPGVTSLAQNPRSLFGKILRIGLADPSRYTIPSDNPFFKRNDAAPEVWALGVQNPVSLSFDSTTKRVMLVDSGREIQELDLIERGRNYGWNMVEGAKCVVAPCDMANLTPPVHSYSASVRSNAIGGFFHNGTSIPGLEGAYIYADSHSKTLFKLVQNGNNWIPSAIAQTNFPIVAVGQGARGEVYVATGDGSVSVITGRP
jgi:glucose/arabinose dehydrogenase